MILEAMFNGWFYPAEMVAPKDPKHKELCHRVTQVTKKLSEKLNKEDMDSVTELREWLFQTQDIELESRFTFGFAVGMLLQWEAFETIRKYSILHDPL